MLRLLLSSIIAFVLVSVFSTALPAPLELVLDDAHPQVMAWPAVTVRGDPSHALTLDDIRREPRAFEAPSGPEGNLGPRRDTVWLHLPLRVAGGDGRWIFDLDYPSIQEAELYLLEAGQQVLKLRLGSAQPFTERPMPSRSLAAMLSLSPGHRYELFLRVRTPSTLVLPIALLKLDQYELREYRLQLQQGLMLGIALSMLVYSLIHWRGLGSSLFGYYAGVLCGSSMFFLTYFGIAQQHLWNQPTDLTLKTAPMAVLLALAAGGKFVAQALDTRRHTPRLHGFLNSVSAVSFATFSASLIGLLDYHATQAVATAMGPTLMILAIPAAWNRARQRDPTGIYLLLGWVPYMLGAFTLAGLLRGLLPANPWTQHLYQWTWLIEMLVWMRVLGLNIESVRRAAERAEMEKQSLESMVHTDPLTGLPNRRGLAAALGHAIWHRSPDDALAVYLLDLDGFKAVNDSLGHDAGDELLVQVSRRLRQQLRHHDVIARLGGDEFVIVASSLRGEAEALTLGRKLLDAFEHPFVVAGRSCRVGLTIGFALAPQDGHDATDLLKRADTAMYAGKQAGRHTLRRWAASPEPA